MKKVKYISYLFLIVLLFTGCEKKNAKELLQDALEKTNNSNSYSMEVKTTVSAGEYANKEMISGTYTKNSSHYTSKIAYVDDYMDVEVYELEKDNKLYQYNSGDGGKTWGYYIYDIPKMRESLKFLNSIVSITDTVNEVKTDLKGSKKLELILDKKKLNELFGSSEEIVGLDLSKDFIAIIYIKDGYISKLEIDFANMLTKEYKENITEYTMNFSYTNYNKVNEIEIPDDIISNAVLADDDNEEE